jgi:hypothetical protein
VDEASCAVEVEPVKPDVRAADHVEQRGDVVDIRPGDGVARVMVFGAPSRTD